MNWDKCMMGALSGLEDDIEGVSLEEELEIFHHQADIIHGIWRMQKSAFSKSDQWVSIEDWKSCRKSDLSTS